MRLGDLPLSYFPKRCKTLSDIFSELQIANLEADCTAACNRRDGDWKKKKDTILSFEQAEKICRFLLARNLKFTESEDVAKLETYDEYNIRTGGHHYKSGVYIKRLELKTKKIQFRTGIGKCIDIANQLEPLRIPFDVSYGWNIEFFCELDFYVANVLKSNDSEEVKKLNEKRWTSLVNRRKVRDVCEALDGN